MQNQGIALPLTQVIATQGISSQALGPVTDPNMQKNQDPPDHLTTRPERSRPRLRPHHKKPASTKDLNSHPTASTQGSNPNGEPEAESSHAKRTPKRKLDLYLAEEVKTAEHAEQKKAKQKQVGGEKQQKRRK